MNAVNTGDATRKGRRGTVFYDAECGLCTGFVRWLGPTIERRGFVFLPMQSVLSRERLGLRAGDELPEEMRLILPDGMQLGGVAALAFMARRVWWLWPGTVLVELPGLRIIARAGYRWVARNRRCLGGTCQPSRKRRRTSKFFQMP